MFHAVQFLTFRHRTPSGRGDFPRKFGMTSFSIHVRARHLLPLIAGMGALWLAAPAANVAQAHKPVSAPHAAVRQKPAADTTAGMRLTPSQFVLQNGMHVVVIPDTRAPVVTHLIAIRSGAADDPAQLSGVAHFLARMMKEGTNAAPDDSYANTIARDGGTEQSLTTQDYTFFYVRIGADKLRQVMHLEADRLSHLTFGGEKIEATSDQILAERRQQVLNDPHALALEQARAALYLTHPYGTPVIGWNNDIRHIARGDVVSYYKRHYAPNNAILVVVGDVKPDAVRAMAEAEYGSLPRQRLVRRDDYTMPPRLGETRLNIAQRGIRVPELIRIYRVQSYANAAPGVAEALELAAHMLGGDAGAILPRVLVHTRHLATSISVRYNGYASDAGEFIISAEPRPGVDPATLERAIDSELQAFFRHPQHAALLIRAKKQLTDDILFRRDDPLAVAQAFARALAIGLTLQDVTDWPERIRAVTAPEVEKVSASALKPDQAVTVIMTPGR